jgi:bromodomain-containing factor 1
LDNPRYTTAEGFIVDVRRVFSNCLAFNGPDHLVTQMGQRVEAVFDKQIKQLPPPDEPVKPEVKKATPTPPPPPVVKKSGAPTQRRPSTSVPSIRRSDDNTTGRPRREIHAPPPKDLPYSDTGKRLGRPKRATRDDGTAEQLRFCSKLLNDLHKKHLWTVASPFYEPVDWMKLDIPTYPKIIKKPMDLGTMRRKLDNDEYPNAQKFFDDFKLMIRNCFTFNPAGTPVNLAGVELQKIFDEKWKGLPPLRDLSVSDAYDEDDGDDSDAERQRTIASLESQMEELRQNLAAVRSGASKKKPKKANSMNAAASSSSVSAATHHSKPAAAPAPAASSSKPKPAKAASSAKAGSKKGKGKLGDDDVLSFDQKKDLSDAIAQLDGQKLERVIQIIHEGVPEIRDSTEEIELEIDALPATVLTKLYNFVLRPMRAAQSAASGNNPPKRSRAGKSGGTGGLKRKSMDEDVEAEKIRQLEERMRLFDQNANGAANGAPAAAGGHHSDESDDSSDESSGSESE